jgi:gas vesicle protein
MKLNLQDLMDLRKEDALAAIGLAMKPSTGRWMTGVLSTFGLGLLVGAGVGLLLAPRSGQELREDLVDRAKSLRDRATTNAQSAIEEAIT